MQGGRPCCPSPFELLLLARYWSLFGLYRTESSFSWYLFFLFIIILVVEILCVLNVRPVPVEQNDFLIVIRDLQRVFMARDVMTVAHSNYRLPHLLRPDSFIWFKKQQQVFLADAIEAGRRILIVLGIWCGDGATSTQFLGIHCSTRRWGAISPDYLVPKSFWLGFMDSTPEICRGGGKKGSRRIGDGPYNGIWPVSMVC